VFDAMLVAVSEPQRTTKVGKNVNWF